MEIKKIEKSDLVLFPRLQEQGVESRHVEGHGDYWLLHQQAEPHVVVNIQFAADEAEFDRKLGWFIGQQKLHEYVRGDLKEHPLSVPKSSQKFVKKCEKLGTQTQKSR